VRVRFLLLDSARAELAARLREYPKNPQAMQVICVRPPTGNGNKSLYPVKQADGKTVGWLVRKIQDEHRAKHGWELPIDKVLLGASRVAVQDEMPLEAICGKLNPNNRDDFLDLVLLRTVKFAVTHGDKTTAIEYQFESAQPTGANVLGDLTVLLNTGGEYRCEAFVNGLAPDRPFFAAPCFDVRAVWVPPEQRRVLLDTRHYALLPADEAKQLPERLHVLSEECTASLRKFCKIKGVWEKQPQLAVAQLMPYLPQIRQSFRLEQLGAWLVQHTAPLVEPIERALAAGQITFDGLWHVFAPRTQAVGVLLHQGAVEVGFEVESCAYESTMDGQLFVVRGRVIKSNSAQLFYTSHSVVVPEFDGSVALGSLPLRRLDAATRARLEARGRRFCALASGPQFMAYEGCLRQPGYRGWQLAEASGRVMIDGQTHSKFCPNEAYPQPSVEDCVAAVGEHLLYCTWPFLPCFAFKASGQRWGEALVSGLAPIQFRDDAFDRLVLDPAKKEIIRLLVSAQRERNPDLIDGKGCGSIFLLNGPPGVGKTLTAESLAEHLHRPLYAVTIGELGTEPKTLEARLKEVLELGARWNAVLLIDEIDLFAEARQSGDVLRNALVCVFLRLLEYYHGVLFLTSNRAHELDPALENRISLLIDYPAITPLVRLKIWRAQLDAAAVRVTEEELVLLAACELNGRDVQKVLRLAKTIAAERREPCAYAHLQQMIAATRKRL